MRILLAALATALLATPTFATDWLTLPAKYSHDPVAGNRVVQYAPSPMPWAPIETSFRSSGYRQQRSTLAYGQSADNYHRVETWGDPVRPYGEWRFPFRPYSTPYPNWGPPFGGLNINQNFVPGIGFGGGRGGPHRGQGGPRPGQGPNGYGPNASGPGANGPGANGPGAANPRNPYRPGDGSGGFRPRPFNNGGFNNGGFIPDGSGNPYPAGPRSPYPVAPYYDGYYPNYGS